MTTTDNLDAPRRERQKIQVVKKTGGGASDPTTGAVLELLRRRRWQEARVRATAMALERPRDPFPQQALGAVALQTGRAGEAVAHFAKALDRDPGNVETRANLVKALGVHGPDDAAVATLIRAGSQGSDRLTVEQLRREAWALMAACKADAARDRLLDAMDRQPGALALYDAYARLAFNSPKAETTERGVRALWRMLTDPRIDNRGPQRSAGLTLIQELERGSAAAQRGEERPPAPWFTPLLIALLGQALNVSATLEPVLIGLRLDLLRRVAAAPSEPIDQQSLDLAEALARHGFRSEFIWPETDEETGLVATLQEHVEQAIASTAPAPAAALFMLGAYRELSRHPVIRDWVAAVALHAPEQLDPTLRVIAFEPFLEASLTKSLPSLTPIEEGVSTEVQAQYEENPYPRWSAIGDEPARPYIDCIAQQIFPNRAALQATATEPRVLIAGCGSGQHPIGAAQRYEGAQVLGIDLSRASLAYGARQAQQRGMTNIAFAQADILRLDGVDESFDVIETSGVLHHMEDPEAGLGRLVAALKPGGFINIGLYSRAARRHVSAARELIAEMGCEADLAGLRRFRQDVFAGVSPAAAAVAQSADFFAASNLRDLAFHVQEHQFDLLQIKALLEKHSLEFLGFRNRAPDVARAYAAATPDDAAQTDLVAWHAFEAEHPRTFAGMYQFWCRKT